MKIKVYRRKVDTRDEMLDHIINFTARLKERQDALKRATRHVLIRFAKCIDVDGGIFGNILY
jgi:hypothetical protein